MPIWLLFLLGGAGLAVVASSKATKKKPPGGVFSSITPIGKAVAAPQLNTLAGGNAAFDAVRQRWEKLHSLGYPTLAVKEFNTALQAAAIEIQNRGATREKNQETFLSAVSFAFGKYGTDFFKRVLNFASSLFGDPDAAARESLAAANRCFDELAKSALPMWGTLSDPSMYSARNLEDKYCGLLRNYTVDRASHASSLAMWQKYIQNANKNDMLWVAGVANPFTIGPTGAGPMPIWMSEAPMVEDIVSFSIVETLNKKKPVSEARALAAKAIQKFFTKYVKYNPAQAAHNRAELDSRKPASEWANYKIPYVLLAGPASGKNANRTGTTPEETSYLFETAARVVTEV